MDALPARSRTAGGTAPYAPACPTVAPAAVPECDPDPCADELVRTDMEFALDPALGVSPDAGARAPWCCAWRDAATVIGAECTAAELELADSDRRGRGRGRGMGNFE